MLGLAGERGGAERKGCPRCSGELLSRRWGAWVSRPCKYSANGWSSRIGQTYGLAEDWPHYEVADYTRTIDFDAKWSREDYTRRQGKYPLLGRPPMAAEHVTSILSGNYAWDMEGGKAVPITRLYLDGVTYADLRQLELAITPHGFLKAALAAKDATAITLPIVGASDAGLSQIWAQGHGGVFYDRQVPRERND